MPVRVPTSAVIIGIIGLFCGGLGGSVFTWWVTRPKPTVISYQVSSTNLGGAKGLFPDVRIKIGSDELEAAHIHTTEFISQSGPYLDSADPVITFGPNARFFGQVITQAPDPVHHMTCQASGSDLKCTMAPFTGKGERYRVTVASDQDNKPDVFLVAKGVEFKPWEDRHGDPDRFYLALLVGNLFSAAFTGIVFWLYQRWYWTRLKAMRNA